MYHIYVDSIDSVQLFAKRIFHKINDNIIIVSGRSQTSGIGRCNRKWISHDGGLFTTIIFKNIKLPQPLSLYVSFSICKFLRRKYNIDALIKWPNDLIVENRKICGILIDTLWFESKEIIFTGIGINYNNVLPRKIEDNEVMSLSEILGHTIDFESCNEARVLAEMISDLKNERGWLDEYREKSYLTGRNIKALIDGKNEISGRVAGISDTGALTLECGAEIISAQKIIDIENAVI